MRRARRKMEVDTFPFLAVLLCAMGALILLLLVIDRRSKIVAQNTAYERYLAQKRSREADLAERDDARRKAEDAERATWQAKKAELEHKLQSEHDDLQKQRSSILVDIAGLDAKIRDRSEAEKSLVRKLADTRLAVTMSQAELDARQTEIEKTRSEQEGNRRLREEMSQELFRLEAALRTMAERKRSEKPVFSLVPYTGKQGSNRKPIYVELNKDGAIFYPGKQRLSEHDWTGADFRRMVQERTGSLTAEERMPSFDAKENLGPYLLFLVRPDGISGYYAVLDALRGYKVDFGYELVEPDWKFDFAEDKVDALPWRQLTTLDVAPSQVTRPPPKTVSKNWRNLAEDPQSSEPTFRTMGRGGNGGGGNGGVSSSGGSGTGLPGDIPIPPAPGSGGNGSAAGGVGGSGGSSPGAGSPGMGVAANGSGNIGTGVGVGLSGGGNGFGPPSVRYGPGGAANGQAGVGPYGGSPGFGPPGSVGNGGAGGVANGLPGGGGPYVPGTSTGGFSGNGNSATPGPGGGSPGTSTANLGSPNPGAANGGPGGGYPNGSTNPGGKVGLGFPTGVGGGQGTGPLGPYAMNSSGNGGPSTTAPGASGSYVGNGTRTGPLGPYAMNPQVGAAGSPGGSGYYGQGVTGIPNGGAPNGGVPNGNYPNGGYPNGGVPNGGVPNGGVPNGNVPNGNYPNGGYPNGGVPNGNVPNGGAPNGGVPNGNYPNGGYPNGGVPNGGVPNGGVPNGNVPNGNSPNGGVPNGGVPNGGVPNGGIPNGGVPNGGVPNGGVPNGGVPNGGVPNGGVPNGGVPNGGVPNGGVPNGGVPNGGVPNGGVPNGNYPNGGYPNGGVPNGNVPNGGIPNGVAGVGSGGPNAAVPNVSAPFAMPNDLGGNQVAPAPPPPPLVNASSIPAPSFPSLAPKVEPIDPAAQIAAAQAGQVADPAHMVGVGTPGRGGNEAVDPLPNLLPPLPEGPRKTPRPPSVGRLLGNRDFILTIDVVERGAILTPPGRAFDFSDPSAVGQLVTALRKIADARQKTVQPGETPYRVLVRFRVAGDGRRNYYTLYPAIQELGFPMSRESLD